MENIEVKRLLELAAKAASATGAKIVWGNFGGGQTWLTDDRILGGLIPWAPHLNDGDSRRLAVLLRMKVYPGEAYCWDAAVADYSHSFSRVCDEDEEPDTFAATRLAVLRAAAAIGEAMP